MSRRRALSPEQAQAVIAEAARGVRAAQIAKYFGVSTSVVHSVVSGRCYNDVTGVKPYIHDPATCEQCSTRDVLTHNVDSARSAIVEVECRECHTPTSKAVGVVLNSRGSVRCKTCDGRRK